MRAPPNPSDVLTPYDGAFVEWIDSFPVDDVLKAVAILEERRNVLDQHIANFRRTIAMWQDLHERMQRRNSSAPAPDSPAPGKRPPKRLAALNLLQRYPGHPFPLSEIRDRLVQAGEMDDSDKDYHALQVAMSNAVKRGEVERVSSGVYAFVPPDYGIDQLADLEEIEGAMKTEAPASTGVQNS